MAAPCFHRVTRVTGGHEIANFARTHPNTFSTALEKLSDRTLKIFPLHSKNISPALEKSSPALAKKICQKRLAVQNILRIFAASLVSFKWVSGRSYCMRKTFSNVCCCELWTSQTPNLTTGRWQRGVYVVRFYILLYIVRAGVGWWALLFCVVWAMRRSVDPGWAEEQTPTPFL